MHSKEVHCDTSHIFSFCGSLNTLVIHSKEMHDDILIFPKSQISREVSSFYGSLNTLMIHSKEMDDYIHCISSFYGS